jgi:hypothetical protein
VLPNYIVLLGNAGLLLLRRKLVVKFPSATFDVVSEIFRNFQADFGIVSELLWPCAGIVVSVPLQLLRGG